MLTSCWYRAYVMLIRGLYAARLYKELGNHRMAVSACLRGNDFVGAAESCEEEAKRLTGEAAQTRLQEAIKHYKKAKQYLPGFQLLQRHPELAKKMTSEVSPWTLPLLAVLYTCESPSLQSTHAEQWHYSPAHLMFVLSAPYL